MKKRPSIFTFTTVSVAVLASWLTTACNTTTPSSATTPATPQAQRIAEYKSDYDTQPAETQKQLAEGIIAKGQNLKLVYLALGRPDRIVTTPDAKTITWTYRNYVSPNTRANKTVMGNAPANSLPSSSPLTDTFDAWNNNLLKHDEFGGSRVSIIDRVAAKAPTQSWSSYGKYRLNVEMASTPAAKASLNKRAEEDYKEAITIPPISSPDPIQLDVIFIDQRVSDAIIDDSFSAFSIRPEIHSSAP